jgi:hypothetical protein
MPNENAAQERTAHSSFLDFCFTVVMRWHGSALRGAVVFAKVGIGSSGIFVSVACERAARRVKLDPRKFVFSPYCHLWWKRFRIIKGGDCYIDPLRACVIPDKQRCAATARKEA